MRSFATSVREIEQKRITDTDRYAKFTSPVVSKLLTWICSLSLLTLFQVLFRHVSDKSERVLLFPTFLYRFQFHVHFQVFVTVLLIYKILLSRSLFRRQSSNFRSARIYFGYMDIFGGLLAFNGRKCPKKENAIAERELLTIKVI